MTVDRTGLRITGQSEPLYADQLPLMGHREVIGWRKGPLECRVVPREMANALIIANHYSGKVYNASYLHYGAYWEDDLVGVAQYGYAMNPTSQGSVVSGTGPREYLELNRLWVHDRMPRNTESAFLSLTLKTIKASTPVAWVQSFADERCRRFGAVYQACSFLYLGEHTATFWELGDEWYHNSLMTRDPSLSPAAKFVQDNKAQAVAHSLRQFRYIKFLRKGFISRLAYEVLPYPKPNQLEGVA